MFPNAKLTLNLTSTNRLTMAYNRRVDRPGEPELRIFPKYDDPEILKVGNPFLRPQFTNAYEVGFSRSWVGGTGSAAVYHRDVSDAFLRIFAIDDSNPSYDIVNRIFENAGNFRQTGVQLTASHEIVRPWRMTGSVNWFQNDIEALDTILFFPTRRPFTLSALEGPHLGPDAQQPFRPASGARVAGELHPLRVAECAAGARTRPVVARLLRQEAVDEREGRARLHLYRHLQRLRAPARHHRQWFYGALPELPGDAGRDAGIEVPILRTVRDNKEHVASSPKRP